MRRFVYAFLCALLVCSVHLSAVAVDDPDGEVLDALPVDVSSVDLDSLSYDDPVVTTSLYRISASGTNGLKSLVLGLIGDYESIVTDYTYYNNNSSYQSHSITVTPDWPWIVSASFFALVLYCIFRLWGAALCRI